VAPLVFKTRLGGHCVRRRVRLPPPSAGFLCLAGVRTDPFCLNILTCYAMVPRSLTEYSMKITRFHMTDDGGSRFEDFEIPIDQPRPDNFGHTLRQSNAWPSPAIRFVELPAGLDQSWHHAPASQVVVVLSGEVEVGTSDGATRRATTGQAFIADDLTGKGHVTKVIGGPARVMFVELPPKFDFKKWMPT
jgi:hypothetical protein